MHSRFEVYDTFRLSRSLPEDVSIPIDARGVVLMVHGGDPCQYEVEFPNDSGGNHGKTSTFTIGQEYMLLESDQ